MVSISKPVGVSAPPLSVNFTYSPADPETLETIAFSASVSGGTPGYTITWDFGDGNAGEGASVTHAYRSAGTYTVTMTVVDADGATVTVTRTITAM